MNTLMALFANGVICLVLLAVTLYSRIKESNLTSVD